MILHARYILGVLASLVILTPASDASAQVSDEKVWAGFTGRVEVTPQLRLDAEQQVRVGTTDGFEKTFTELALRFSASRRLRLAARYRFAFVDGRGTWHRFAGDLQLRHRLGAHALLSYRLRLQTQSQDNGTRNYVRNKVEAGYEASKRLTPYGAAELHYLTSNSEFRELRLVAGVEYELTKKTALEFFYICQDEFNTGTPETNHILGIAVEHRFRKASSGGKAKKKRASPEP